MTVRPYDCADGNYLRTRKTKADPVVVRDLAISTSAFRPEAQGRGETADQHSDDLAEAAVDSYGRCKERLAAAEVQIGYEQERNSNNVAMADAIRFFAHDLVSN